VNSNDCAKIEVLEDSCHSSQGWTWLCSCLSQSLSDSCLIVALFKSC